jgi:hypothetical protein
MYSVEHFVQHNVIVNITSLVNVLSNPESQDVQHHHPDSELSQLITQATEFLYPVLDYEETATEIGYSKAHNGWVSNTVTPSLLPTAAEVCYIHCHEPHQWPIYEYWVITEYLAQCLANHGERVDVSFAGLHVWGRTTALPPISNDPVIIAIFNEATAPRKA